MLKLATRTLAFLFIFSPLLHAEDTAPLLGGSLLDVLEKGGTVMVIILIGSVIGLALGFERLVSLRRRTLCPPDLCAELEKAVKSHDWSNIADDVGQRKGSLACIVAEGLKRIDHGAGEVERTMEAVGGHEVARLKRPVRPIAILATVMPLLGLLGTILGMITTFNLLGSTSPAERVQMLAPGIGQALYTTAAGLCVSIPFVLLHHILVGRVNRAAERWSRLGSDIVLAIREKGAAAAGAAA